MTDDQADKLLKVLGNILSREGGMIVMMFVNTVLIVLIYFKLMGW